MIAIKILVLSLVAIILWTTTFCFPGGEINNSTQTQGKYIHAEYDKMDPFHVQLLTFIPILQPQ